MHDKLSQSIPLKILTLSLLLMLVIIACENSSEDENIISEQAGENAGEQAGEEVAGETNADEQAGEEVAGETNAGEQAGEEVAGETNAGEQAGEEVAGEQNPGLMCTDASQCPIPPPVAIVDCEGEWVVDVIFTPICVGGLCDMERGTRQLRNCSAEDRVCSDGECLRPTPAQACSQNDPCADNQVCVYNEGLCGAVGFSDGHGQCQVIPEICDTGANPACGCDGQIYGNACNALGQGVDVSQFGGCALGDDSSTFICGEQSCAAQTYCAIFMNDVVGPDQSEYTADCVGLPDLCQAEDMPNCTTCFEPDLFMTCVDVGEQMIVVYPGG